MKTLLPLPSFTAPWQFAADLERDTELLRRRRYGMIDVRDGKLSRIVLRPWPKTISLPEVWWLGNGYHASASGDRCRLYYNEPRSCPGYLTLKYIVSSHGATFATARRAMQILDSIAALKGSLAIVCEASNLRVSDRLLHRWGWERHCLDSPRRHFIKRLRG